MKTKIVAISGKYLRDIDLSIDPSAMLEIRS